MSGRPKKGPAVIAFVEIALTNGLHIKVHPATGRFWAWNEDANGYESGREQGTLEQLIKVIEMVRAEKGMEPRARSFKPRHVPPESHSGENADVRIS